MFWPVKSLSQMKYVLPSLPYNCIIKWYKYPTWSHCSAMLFSVVSIVSITQCSMMTLCSTRIWESILHEICMTTIHWLQLLFAWQQLLISFRSALCEQELSDQKLIANSWQQWKQSLGWSGQTDQYWSIKVRSPNLSAVKHSTSPHPQLKAQGLEPFF